MYPNVNSVRIEKAFFCKQDGSKILDYGFGFAQETCHFLKLGYEVWGLDISETGLKRANERIQAYNLPLGKSHLELVNPAWDTLPYQDNFFDVIHSNQVIYFLADIEKIQALIKDFYRILKPGGKIYVSLLGTENSICSKGTKVGENIYIADWKDETRKWYVFPDKKAIEKAFEAFNIVEIGSFGNDYCGVNGFHWVVLADKTKR